MKTQRRIKRSSSRKTRRIKRGGRKTRRTRRTKRRSRRTRRTKRGGRKKRNSRKRRFSRKKDGGAADGAYHIGDKEMEKKFKEADRLAEKLKRQEFRKQSPGFFRRIGNKMFHKGAEEQARKEAEEQARKEAEEQARKEAEEQQNMRDGRAEERQAHLRRLRQDLERDHGLGALPQRRADAVDAPFFN